MVGEPRDGAEPGRSASERISRAFEIPVIVAALLVIPVLVLEEAYPGEPWNALATAGNWAIWLTFLLETVTMLLVSPDRVAWVRRHPFELAVVVLTPPFLPAAWQSARAFRLLRLVRLALTARQVREIFSLEGLRYASVLAVFGILGGGVAFASVEKAQNLNAWDGVWWAITTVTTVGYGDIAPKTTEGRLIAILIMIVGIGYVAMLTAAMAQLFVTSIVRRESDVVHVAESEVLARIDRLSEHVERLEAAVRKQHDESA